MGAEIFTHRYFTALPTVKRIPRRASVTWLNFYLALWW